MTKFLSDHGAMKSLWRLLFIGIKYFTDAQENAYPNSSRMNLALAYMALRRVLSNKVSSVFGYNELLRFSRLTRSVCLRRADDNRWDS